MKMAFTSIALNMRSGPQHRYTMVERLPMATETDYVDWLARLEKLPEQLAQYQALLQAGLTSNARKRALLSSASRISLMHSLLINPGQPLLGRVRDTARCNPRTSRRRTQGASCSG